MKGSEVRAKFLDYFRSKGHTVVASSSLVPDNDPTLLFTNAGMNQFKDCFLGADKRAYTRAATCQKCMRISGKHNDLENVGVTARHHTFFEMLGNFSFGDYFKADAIKYGWEFVTGVLGLPKERLWVTIFEEDDEAGKLWLDLTDVGRDRVIKLGAKDNFWAMGETGPCGPCSEIHIYLGDDLSKQSEKGFREEDGSYLEIWNLVFMQFDRGADGKLTPLPKPSVDTGMGLERVTHVLQGKGSNYDTDLLRPIISVCEKLSGFRYDGSSFEVRDLKKDEAYARDVAMRVIADHSRAAAFLIADGVTPSSDGRGYVLRRVIRRAIRHGRALEFGEPFLKRTTAEVVSMMGEHYPELRNAKDSIERIVDAEERKFHETLDAGLAVLTREVEKLGKGQLFPGEVAFLLHDTYGFPLDLTEDALKAYDTQVDRAAFDRAMSEQKKRSREERKAQGLVFSAQKIEGPKTEFLGYDELAAESKLVQAIDDGGRLSLVFEATPFYAESGGQVGDTGTITFAGAKLRVLDTQKIKEGYFIHQCELVEGDAGALEPGVRARLEVDAERRARIRANHSCTHLVHSALRRVLGAHVKQAGSRVDEETLRFDYSHFEPVTREQLSEIGAWVNGQIRANHEVVTEVMSIEDAKKSGAIALFGEKYGDLVRVVTIGPDSKELCGGTHAGRSGDLGLVMIAAEGGVSSGVRRIECWSGAAAAERLAKEREELSRLASLLKSDSETVYDKVERLQSRVRQLEKELETAKSKIASAASGDLASNVRTSPGGVKVIAARVDAADPNTLRGMVDRLRQKIGSGVVALGSNQGDKAIIVAGVTPDLVPGLHAGALVQEAAKSSGGKGGGRPDFAQAGGVDPSLLNQTLEKLFELIA